MCDQSGVFIRLYDDVARLKDAAGDVGAEDSGSCGEGLGSTDDPVFLLFPRRLCSEDDGHDSRRGPSLRWLRLVDDFNFGALSAGGLAASG